MCAKFMGSVKEISLASELGFSCSIFGSKIKIAGVRSALHSLTDDHFNRTINKRE